MNGTSEVQTLQQSPSLLITKQAVNGGYRFVCAHINMELIQVCVNRLCHQLSVSVFFVGAMLSHQGHLRVSEPALVRNTTIYAENKSRLL